MTDRATAKSERLLQIEALLLHHPEGLSQAELARRLGVHRSTIYRDLPELTTRFAIYETSDGRLMIDRSHYFTNVRFTLHEAMAIHLATRLMAQHSDKANPHTASAVRKLSTALEQLAPFISDHLGSSADVLDAAALRRDPVYVHALETLTVAWSLGRKVNVEHQMPDGHIFNYVFAPWYIEPYAPGRTSHVIGWREPPQAVRTFKIERIRGITLRDEHYAIPEDFDPREHLASAWGIWTSDEEPEDVVLRFNAAVAERVRETQWHPLERLEEQMDGSVLWHSRIAEPREMLPWIRGWGADVEVLAPVWVREHLADEVRRMMLAYDVGKPVEVPLFMHLWGKIDKKTGQIHPLLCHMLDVAAVVKIMWQRVLTDGMRGHFSKLLGLSEDDTGELFAFWAGLHDLGKACPGFQRKNDIAKQRLQDEGFSFKIVYGRQTFKHGTATALLVPDWLIEQQQLARRWAKQLAGVLGGHHGTWPVPLELQAMEMRQDELGTGLWAETREALLTTYKNLFTTTPLDTFPNDVESLNGMLTVLSGLVSIADWMGSMMTYFPYQSVPFDLNEYYTKALAQAELALAALNWLDWEPPTAPINFIDLFALPSPRPMQAQVIEMAEHLMGPALVIIEAPTGTGKTEAALYLADHWARTQQQRGLYVAMPTMATSNQMYSRVLDMVTRRYPKQQDQVLLIHSQSRWMHNQPTPELTSINSEEGLHEQVHAMQWFLPSKRSLLAPLAVGTVDQSLLSVMQTRHFFVRLLGLSHKTVIFDEVHAYDTYMSTLFERLLTWLRAIGTSVVILTATLPAETRQRLLQAYAGSNVSLPEIRYPLISWAQPGKAGWQPVIHTGSSRNITLTHLERDEAHLVDQLRTLLVDGGCAAVICNTVGRAQHIYSMLRDAGPVSDGNLILFHARFPFGQRQEVERQVLSLFGKNGPRPARAIVVATQVIEQSLDLDFDVMFSDMAPVDLLIQRAGRLHRHQRAGRPASLTTPTLHMICPPEENGLPRFDRADTYLYDKYILLRTWLALASRESFLVPDDTESLIEAVYSQVDQSCDEQMREAIEEAQEKMRLDQEKEIFEARKRLVPGPDARNLLRGSNMGLEEDNPDVGRTFQALTRLAPPSVTLVCLHRIHDRLNTRADGSGVEIKLGSYPHHDVVQELVNASVSTSHYEVVAWYRETNPTPTAWKQHALLHRYGVAIFENQHCILEGKNYELRLDDELGLLIEKLDV